MNKLSILSLVFAVIIFSFYACKKDEPIEKKLIGTWELNKITFLETNVSYPLDSFRNLINVNLKLNGDLSFNETEDFGKFTIGPLGSTIIEDYTTPRNAKARYIIEKYFREYETSKYSISGDSISFYYKFKYGALFSEEKHNKKFVLKSDKELDIERLDLLIHNKNIPYTGYHKLRLSYTKK